MSNMVASSRLADALTRLCAKRQRPMLAAVMMCATLVAGCGGALHTRMCSGSGPYRPLAVGEGALECPNGRLRSADEHGLVLARLVATWHTVLTVVAKKRGVRGRSDELEYNMWRAAAGAHKGAGHGMMWAGGGGGIELRQAYGSPQPIIDFVGVCVGGRPMVFGYGVIRDASDRVTARLRNITASFASVRLRGRLGASGAVVYALLPSGSGTLVTETAAGCVVGQERLPRLWSKAVCRGR